MSRASTDDMRDAVHALLRDMRSGNPTTSSRGGDDGPQMTTPYRAKTGSELADIAVLRVEIDKLEKELRASQEALRMERQQHANTKELLRLALRSSAPDAVLEGSPDRRSRTSPHRALTPSEVPAFVKNATQMTLSPRHLQTSGTVIELFNRVSTTPKRGRTPTRAAPNANQQQPMVSGRSSSNGSSFVGGRQPARQSVAAAGSRASSPGASLAPFGSRAQRFQGISLTGHHATFVGTAAHRSDELTREEAKQLANEMRKAGLITPTKSPRPGPSGESPVFTGMVKASPSAAARLRSPDIAAWVKQLGA